MRQSSLSGGLTHCRFRSLHRRLSISLSILVIAGRQQNAEADDAFDLGVDDLTVAEQQPVQTSNIKLSLRGFVRSEWHLWSERFDSNPWAKGRQNLDLVLTAQRSVFQFKAELHGEYDLAYLHQRDDYDQATLRAYEFQFLTRDLLLAISLGPWEITLGRQIVAWGEGDTLSPLDVVSPRDLREPGLADLEDIRLPVLASRIGLFIGNHRFEAMWVHEFYPGLRSPPLGPLSPFPSVLAPEQEPTLLASARQADFADKQNRFGLAAQQLYLRWVYKGPGIDLGAYAAYLRDRSGVLTAVTLDDEALDLALDHRAYGVLGNSGAWSSGPLVFKWEFAFQLSRPFNAGVPSLPALGFPLERATLVDLMGGTTWTPIADLQLSFELGKSTFIDKPKALLFPVDQPQLVLRLNWTTLRDRLNAIAVASVIGLDSDFDVLLRAELNYNAISTLDVGIGYAMFFPGDDASPISGFKRHDRLILKLRWDFTLL